MSTDTSQKQDHWSSEAYSAAADFVPKLTSTVVAYLNVQPDDKILDIGCGDGQLTAQLARAAPLGTILGIDSSASFIQTALEKHSSANCTFRLHNGRALESCSEAVNGSWDKVFSNAALHWILEDQSSARKFFSNVYRALRLGGSLVFEMGGHGNVADVHSAVNSALLHAGVTAERARQASPWYFPSPEAMHACLSEAGFDVEKCYVEYRPTKLTASNDAGTGSIEGWIKLMCAEFLSVVPMEQRQSIINEVCQVVDPAITKEDGSKWLGYVRLRVVAIKR